eukprot:TRINITY_DN18077_c0_g1_i1.p1 TRINITY_DN18077_c0_g1~~TRINITY_DN18077_c0_g1_i1.p1  ORF type:complete len:126 (-),score=30.37 TRINITY_DN18077_c0_g1_i1:113-490(-)
MSFEQVAQAFVAHYYNTFDSDRTQLGNLYRPESMLSWEGSQVQGAGPIVDKLKSLTFQSVKHHVVTCDAQPSFNNGVTVFVCGTLAVDGAFDTPMKYSQVFNLQPIPGQAGGFFVLNDLFRLNIG